MVDSVEVEVGANSPGVPEAYAIVKGRLSSSAAQLIDARQSRVDRTLVLEVLEQTPRGATLLPDLAQSPPFETRIPIEILDLNPGPACSTRTASRFPLRSAASGRRRFGRSGHEPEPRPSLSSTNSSRSRIPCP